MVHRFKNLAKLRRVAFALVVSKILLNFVLLDHHELPCWLTLFNENGTLICFRSKMVEAGSRVD